MPHPLFSKYTNTSRLQHYCNERRLIIAKIIKSKLCEYVPKSFLNDHCKSDSNGDSDGSKLFRVSAWSNGQMIPTPRCTNILEIVVLFGDHRNAAHVRSYTADKSHVRGARRQACTPANIWSVLVDFGYICTWVVSYVYTSREQDAIYASTRRTHYVGQRRTRYNDALTSSREHFKITRLARTLTRRSCTLGNPIEYHWHGSLSWATVSLCLRLSPLPFLRISSRKFICPL